MSAPDWSTKPTLVGERVTLRPFAPGDAEAMLECFDEDALRLTGSAHTTAQAQAEAARTEPDERLQAWYATRNGQTDRLDLAITDQTGQLVGEVVLNDWDAGNQSCGFRIVVGAAGRDRGLGTEATRLILDHAFDVLELHRVELEYYTFNPRAGHVYAKAGFLEEGRRRDALLYDGQWYDAVVMSVVATDR